jgi:hypothetical protein
MQLSVYLLLGFKGTSQVMAKKRKSTRKACKGKPWKKYAVGSKAYMAAIRKKRGCKKRNYKRKAKKSCRKNITAAKKRWAKEYGVTLV